jgi:hypothetical protein
MMTNQRLARLLTTLSVIIAASGTAGYIAGNAGENARAEHCSNAVAAAMDMEYGGESAPERFAENAGKCL